MVDGGQLPFRFGEIVAGAYFADREAELQLLARDIEQGQNVVLISPRRFGKTSLILRVIEQVRQAGVLVAYVDLLRAPSKERLGAPPRGCLREAPPTIGGERNRRVALVLDEFQEIMDLDPHLPALMRGVFQTQGEVAHVFLGSRQHLLRRVFTDRGQPLYRLAPPMTLGPIAESGVVP